MRTPAVASERVVALTQALAHEAHLLDAGRYEDWLALLDPGIVYSAPIIPDVMGGDDGGGDGPRLHYFNDDLGLLQLRVAKVRTGLAQTEHPPSRCVRLVASVHVGAETAADEHPVVSAFVLYRHRRQRQVEILAGHRNDRWRLAADGWRLARREVHFAANVLPTKSLSLIY